MEKYFLGIDIGTYESKGSLVDENFKIIKTISVPHSLSIPKPGWAEHDAELIWWKDFTYISRELLKEIDVSKLEGVGCSAIAPTMLPVGYDGKPLRPAILYGIDTRAYKEIEELENFLGKEYIKIKCWNSLSSQSVGPKILWFKKNEPELYKKTWKVMTASTYLVYKLTGNVVIDYYTAATYTPLLDMEKLKWIDTLQKIIPIEKLPDLLWTCQIAGKVTKEASQETGIPTGTPVIVGTADAAAEFISAGGSQIGDLMIMMGTTIFFIELLSSRPYLDQMWNSVFLEPNTYCIAGGMSTGGALTRWFRDNFGKEELEIEKQKRINAYEILYKQAEKIPPGANGLIVLPYFSGERTPINDPHARGVIAGVTLAHSKYHIYRAILEGISYGIRHNIDTISQANIKISRVLAVGGGVKNPLWLRILSSVIKRKIFIPSITIGASFGDCFLAAIGVGRLNSILDVGEIVRNYDSVDPVNFWEEIYEKYYSVYRALWENIKEEVHLLSLLGGEQ
jgi:xylulokinase